LKKTDKKAVAEVTKPEAKKPKEEVKKEEKKPKNVKEPPKIPVDLENIVNTKREKHAPAKFTPSPAAVAAYHSQSGVNAEVKKAPQPSTPKK
jgi:hypothetical protein